MDAGNTDIPGAFSKKTSYVGASKYNSIEREHPKST